METPRSKREFIPLPLVNYHWRYYSSFVMFLPRLRQRLGGGSRGSFAGAAWANYKDLARPPHMFPDKLNSFKLA